MSLSSTIVAWQVLLGLTSLNEVLCEWDVWLQHSEKHQGLLSLKSKNIITMTWAVSTTAHLCTSRTYFECLVRSHWQNQQNSVHCKYLDGALETVKKWNVKRWTLRALSGRHLGYIAEEEEPFRQLFTRRAPFILAGLVSRVSRVDLRLSLPPSG